MVGLGARGRDRAPKFADEPGSFGGRGGGLHGVLPEPGYPDRVAAGGSSGSHSRELFNTVLRLDSRTTVWVKPSTVGDLPVSSADAMTSRSAWPAGRWRAFGTRGMR